MNTRSPISHLITKEEAVNLIGKMEQFILDTSLNLIGQRYFIVNHLDIIIDIDEKMELLAQNVDTIKVAILEQGKNPNIFRHVFNTWENTMKYWTEKRTYIINAWHKDSYPTEEEWEYADI